MSHFLSVTEKEDPSVEPRGTHTAPRPENSLLASLPPEARAVLLPRLRERVLKSGDVLWDVGERPHSICFPVTGVVAVVVPTKTGSVLQVGSVGHEGATGFYDEANQYPTVTRTIVQAAGTVLLLSIGDWVAAARQNEVLRELEVVCKEWLLVQAQQTAVCNALHSADARFSHWLLRMADATANEVFGATHVVVAEMLGLRRTTITLIAQTLQAAGLIRYRRGIITIRDRAGLEAIACECCQMTGRRQWPSEVMKAFQTPGLAATMGFD